MPYRPTDRTDLYKAKARLDKAQEVLESHVSYQDRIAAEAIHNGLIKIPDRAEVDELEPLAETPEEKSVIKYFATGGNVPHNGHYITIQRLRAKHIQKLKEIQKMRSVQQIVKTDGQSVLEFNGHKIHFEVRDGVVYVDATETAKPYNKRPGKFLELPSTKEYIDALSENRTPVERLYFTEIGGKDGGNTWLHYKLALRFAGWLDVKLQIWMDEQIESILRGETISLKPKSPAHALLEQVQLMVKHEEQMAEHENRLKHLEAKTTTHQADFFTVAGYASLNGQKIDLTGASNYGRKAAKLSRDQGYAIGQINDPRFGQVNTYHTDILRVVMPVAGLVKVS